MTEQTSLFYESIHDATRELTRVLGGAKTVGALLWPGKSIQDAQTRLLNCLDHNRPDKLSPEELLALMKRGRQVDCHIVMHFLAQECGYRAEPIEPENERARLQREFVESVKRLDQIRGSLERIETQPLKAVR